MYRKLRVSSGSEAIVSTHEFGPDALGGPAQDRVDLSCREFGFHAIGMIRAPGRLAFGGGEGEAPSMAARVRRPGPYPNV